MKKLKTHLIALGLSLVFAGVSVAHASTLDLKFQGDLTEDDYRTIVFPIVNPLRHMFVNSAAPTGLTGFDVGLAVTGFQVPKEARDTADEAVGGDAGLPTFFAVPRITAQKGIPFGIDFGLNVALIPSTDILLVGGGLQWAFLDGPFPIPSAAIRLGHSQLLGLDELEAQSTTAVALLSFGLPPGVNLIKPYAGGGLSWVSAKSVFTVSGSDSLSQTSVNINEETTWQDAFGLVGLQVTVFPFTSISFEAQLSAEQVLYTGKLAIGF